MNFRARWRQRWTSAWRNAATRRSALDSDDRFDARAEEPLAHPDEAFRHVDREEAGVPRALAAIEVVGAKRLADLARSLDGRVHDRDVRTHDLRDERLQQRVVRAAEDERVDSAPGQAREI